MKWIFVDTGGGCWIGTWAGEPIKLQNEQRKKGGWMRSGLRFVGCGCCYSDGDYCGELWGSMHGVFF